MQRLHSRDFAAVAAGGEGGHTTINKQSFTMDNDKAAGTTRGGMQESNQGRVSEGGVGNR